MVFGGCTSQVLAILQPYMLTLQDHFAKHAKCFSRAAQSIWFCHLARFSSHLMQKSFFF